MPGASLILIPVPLGEQAPESSLSAATIAAVHALDHFAVERAKTARAHLRAFSHPRPLQSLAMVELDGPQADESIREALGWLIAGHDVGLMSEAGCPAVADPGSRLVAQCHDRGIRVRPLVGPSSLLLAVMASGLNGQKFAFHGYLPAKPAPRATAIRELEKRSQVDNCLQLFIETPYRNAALLHSLLAECRESTRLCIAADLTLESEWVKTASIANWRRQPAPVLDKRPTVFLLDAG